MLRLAVASALLLAWAGAVAACIGGAPLSLPNDGGPVVLSEAPTYGQSNCVRVIGTTTPGMVQLATLYWWSLGNNNDRLLFYDGPSTSAPLISTVRQNNDYENGYVYSTQGYLTIVLALDNFDHTDGGYYISIEAVPPPVHCAPMRTVRYWLGDYSVCEPVGVGAYIRNGSCGWVLERAPGDGTFLVNFDSIGERDIAPGDVYYIYDGPTESAPLLGAVGYDSGHSAFYFTSNTSLVKLVSQDTDKFGFSGFCFRVGGHAETAHCPGGRQVINVTASTLDILGEPAVGPFQGVFYQPGLTCEWEIRALPGRQAVFLMRTAYFNYPYATMDLYDGDHVGAPVLFSSSTLNYQPYISTGGVLLARFSSDPYRPPRDGVSFYASSDGTPTSCAQPLTTYSNGYANFGVPSLVYKNVPYRPNLNCSFNLQPSTTGQTISLIFNDFSLNPGDYVTVTTYNALNQPTLFRTFNGSRGGYDKSAVNLVVARVVVNFVSGPVQGSAYGFNIESDVWARLPQCSGNTVLSPGAVLTMTNVNAHVRSQLYRAPASCSWSYASSSYAVLRLDTFQIRPGDHLKVYDGTNNASPLLGDFTGLYPLYGVAQYLLATGSNIYTEFIASGPAANTSAFGFVAQVQDVSTPPTPPNICPGQGSILLGAYNNSYGVRSGTPGRFVTCVWTFTRPDYTGLGFQIYQGGIQIPNTPDATLVLYDGPSTSSPVLWMINGTSGYQSPLYDDPLSTSPVLTIVFTTGTYEGATFAFDVSAPSVLPSYLGYRTNGTCSGTYSDVNVQEGFQTIQPFSTAGLTPKSNMLCRWLITVPAGQPPGFYIEIGQNYVGGYKPYAPAQWPGRFSWAVYDGPNNTAPVLLNASSDYNALSTGDTVLVEFITTSMQQMPTYAFFLRYRTTIPLVPCSGAKVDYLAGAQYLGTNSNYDGNFQFPFARTCTWLLTTVPTGVFVLSEMTHALANDAMTIFDGNSTSSPVLWVLHPGEPAPVGLKTSGASLFVLYEAPVGNRGCGAYFRVEPTLPVPQCSGVQEWTFLRFVDPYFYGSGQQLRHPDSADNNGRVDYRYMFPDGDNKACEYYMKVPYGALMDVSIDMSIPNGSLSLYNNGLLIATFTGVYSSIYQITSLCYGEIRVKVNYGPLAGAGANFRVGFAAHFDRIPPARCLVPDDVYCCQNVDVYSEADALPYANCTLIGALRIHGAGNYHLPNMRGVQDTLLASFGLSSTLPTEYGRIELPNLRAVPVVSFYDLLLTGMNFSSLEYSDCFDLDNVYVPSIVLPSMYNLEQIDVKNMATITEIRLPIVRTLQYIFIDNMPALTTFTTPLLVQNWWTVVWRSPKIKAIEFPSLQSFGRLEVQQTLQTTFSLPSVTNTSLNTGSLTLEAMGNLQEVDLCNMTGIQTLALTQTPQLHELRLPRLSYIYTLFLVENIRVDTIEAPVLQSVGALNLTASSALTGVYMPELELIDVLTLEDTSIEILNLPSVAMIPSGIELTRNVDLSQLDLCALTQSGNVTVSVCPKLSCQETIRLFDAAGAGAVDALSPDCDPVLLGSFGCVENVTRTVNTSRCGFNLACIQYEISASYADKGGRVYVPPGTYTGCASPLQTKGKIITIFGAGASATVLDCQGSGRAFVLESTPVQIQDMTVRNGASASGGLMLVTNGAAPTILRVAFSSGSALTSGGAVAVTNAASPRFISCVFSNNLAATGGGVAATVASLSMDNCTLLGNTAGVQGAGMYLASALSLTTIVDSSLLANTAPQGAGIFTDSPLLVDGGLFSANSAAQFGGGVACVPADEGAPLNVSITGARFVGNNAGTGGGVYGFSANLDVRDVTFGANTAAKDGAGLQALCSPSYRILMRVRGPCDVSVTLDHVQFTNNVAGGNGGGAGISDARVTVTGGAWSGNVASRSGGGVYIKGSYSVLSGGVVVSGNHALQNGGGLYCEPISGSCTFTGITISDNTADVTGGGVYLCTAGCPNTTAIPGDGGMASLAAIVSANTFAGNAVGAGGYGVDISTDPTLLVWQEMPLATVVSGRLVNDDGTLAVAVTDAFSNLVTSSSTLLAVSLETAFTNGSVTNVVSFGGASTALALDGVATLSGVSMQAPLAYTGANYILRAKLSSSSIAVIAPVYLAPCQPGQGLAAGVTDGPAVCVDCAVGYAGSADTNFLCVQCAPGSIAATTPAATCTPCPVNTHASLAGATVCEPCLAGYAAPAVGSADCQADSAINANLVGPVVGASLGVLLIVVIGAVCLWRLARRKTMQKYYLDSDSTIRASGLEETPLMKSVKKIIGATSTTRIGGGLYADVYKAKYEGRWIALKVIKKEDLSSMNAQNEFRREAVALGRLLEVRHPGVVELVFFLDRNPMCLALEFCGNGTLKQLLPTRKLNTQEKVRLATEAAAAMLVVHASQIVHLDVKTDNLLLDDDLHIKLADFGIARIMESRGSVSLHSQGNLTANPLFAGLAYESANGGGGGGARGGEFGTIVGAASTGSMGSVGTMSSLAADPSSNMAFTPQYACPLRLQDNASFDLDFLRQTDVFSFGIVMWAIWSQEEPYAGVPPDELIQELKMDVFKRPRDLPDAHPTYARIMKHCWHAQPTLRPSFAEAFEQLHALLRDGYSGELAPGYAPSERVASMLSGSRIDYMPSGAAVGSMSSVAPPPPPPAAIDSLASIAPPPPPAARPPPEKPPR